MIPIDILAEVMARIHKRRANIIGVPEASDIRIKGPPRKKPTQELLSCSYVPCADVQVDVIIPCCVSHKRCLSFVAIRNFMILVVKPMF